MKAKAEIDRSAVMRSVKSTDTKPEMAVRSFVHRMGFRFRLHQKCLPGTPDLVFPRLRKVVFVHGCFWHGHSCARGDRVPRSNRKYWVAKISRNRERDQLNLSMLEAEGWEVYIAWECKIGDAEFGKELRSFLEHGSR